MYDEDRQTALTMYERMFDETADEQGLLQLLVSPTRQAVVLARSYDAKQRKLQIESRSQDDNYMPDPEDVPSFIFVIDKTAQQAAELGVKSLAVSEDQFSIFDEFETAEEPVEPFDEDTAADSVELPAEEEAEEETPVLPEQDTEEEALPQTEPESTESIGEEDGSEESSNVEETAKAMDAFLADFTVENGELVSNNTEAEPVHEEAVDAAEESPESVAEAVEVKVQTESATRVKTNIFLLILYVFAAIPLGFAGVALLLIPAALFLSLAVTFVCVGVSLIGMCFSSFAVIADMMVVFGAGLILVALGLLFVWLFIWFIGCAIVGFIRGVCRLGRKICCKEVAVQ